MDIAYRQKIEETIVSQLIKDALDFGYTLGVHNGNERVISNSNDSKKILEEMFTVDEEHLIFYMEGKLVGAVFLVYGNCGYDVICDYSVKLEHIMDNVDKLFDKYENEVYWAELAS